MRKAIAILALLLVVGAARAQTSEVPFYWQNGYIFVDATVNGITGKYLFDTGATMAIMHSRAQKGTFETIGEMPILDSSGKKSAGMPIVKLQSFSLGEMNSGGGVQALVLNEGNVLEMMGIDGVVGSSFLAPMVVRLDSRRGVISFSNSVEPYGLKKSYGIPMRIEPAGTAFIDIDMGKGVTEQALVDTGANDFFNLSYNAYERLKDGPAIDTIATILGVGSIGATGYGKNEKKDHRIKIGELTIGRGKFVNLSTETVQGPLSLLGVKLLEHGIVTLDYPNRRFYFEPFDHRRVNMYEPEWDIMAGGFRGELRIATKWKTADPNAEVGAQVLSVDGIDYTGDPMSFLPIQRKKTDATERVMTIRKKDGTEVTVTSHKR
jgi:predicted aspartyl protease